VDLRLVAATNRNLEQMVREGTFREDLYYRLNVVPVQMPPLRKRAGDIPILAQYFLDLFNREFRKNLEGITSDALDRLNDYAWPGNVRELRNAIERAVLLNDGDVVKRDDIVLGHRRLRSRGSGKELASSGPGPDQRQPNPYGCHAWDFPGPSAL